MTRSYRYLLIQIRDQDDPVRLQEVDCFARALACDQSAIEVFNLLSDELQVSDLRGVDMAMIGGSGRYSVTSNAPWLTRGLRSLVHLVESGRPTFGSCWGFQALARALGGTVKHDLENAELGTNPVTLTDAGKQDPIFSQLPDTFLAYMGHEDRVTQLPPGAVLLASTAKVAQQAFCLHDRPVYCTQFHPELNLAMLLRRVEAYPEYCERIAKIPFTQFRSLCREALESEGLLRLFRDRFVR